MKKSIGFAALIALMLSFTIPAHAGAQDVIYVAAAGVQEQAPHPPAASAAPYVGIGGFSFGPHKYTKIHIADAATSADVQVDIDSPQAGVSLSLCTNANGDVFLPTTYPTASMFVFIWAVGLNCSGTATAGTMTVSYS